MGAVSVRLAADQGDGAAGRPAYGSRSDASMSLLTDLMTNTVDGGYAEATARRRAAGQPAARVLTTPVVFVGLLLVGLLLATAAAQVRNRASAVDTARAALVAQVRERTAATDRLAADVERLRADIDAARRQSLRSAGGATLAERLAVLGTVSGAGPVVGPGLVVTVDDAADTGAPAGGDPRDRTDVDEGRVQDSDLQRVVNGLWAAGAEGVSVNGQRLTSLTAIRSAGEAILVAYRPLAPPYVLRAVGDPTGLETGLLDGDAGTYLLVLRDNYGIEYDVERAESLRLPGAAGVTLRRAVSAGPSADASDPTPSAGESP